MPAGHYSLNTLAVSQLSSNRRMVDGIVSFTVSHELGHSFGALHDDDHDRAECMPAQGSMYGKEFLFEYQ